MVKDFLICLLVFFFPLLYISGQDHIDVGYFEFPPHVMTENGEAVGPAVDFFNLLAQEMGFESWSFQHYPINRLFDYLENGRVDMGLYFAKNEERASRFIYPQSPYTYVPLSLAFRSDHPLEEIVDMEEIYPLTIGYLQGAYLPDQFLDPRMNFVYLYGQNWTFQNLSKVQAGRIDAALSGYYQMIFDIKNYQMEQDIKVLTLPFSTVEIFNVLSPSFAEDNLQLYQESLDRLLSQTSYDQIFNEFLEEME